MTAVKFRSLIFREFRISRKSILLQFGLLFAWIALSWAMQLSSMGSGDFSEEQLSGTVDIIIMATALCGAMYLLMDEVFKSDIDSGWLRFSYALPITPFERTAARFVRRASVCFAGALIGLCNGAAVCANAGKPFGANYIVWYIVILAAVIFGSLPSNIFTLRARSQAGLKKAQTAAGLTMTGLMIVLVAVIFLASGADLKKLTESDSFFRLPEFTAGALAWAVPLLILMTAASFFTAYRSFKCAYSGAVRPENRSADAVGDAVPEHTDGAVGLLYKELKQNRLVFILAACVPVLFTVFPFCFSAVEVMTGSADVNKMFEMSTNLIIRVLMYVVGFFAVSGLMTEVFKGDDRKLWAYFVVSLPQGVKGFMYRKYVITFMMNLIFMISGILAEHLLATVNYFVTGTELAVNMQGLYISGVFILMFTAAFDIPFTVRYGSKKGSMIKMITMLSVLTAVIAVYSFLLPENIRSRIMSAAAALLNGQGGDTPTLILSFCPYIALSAFLLSYFVSCRMFIKGVNEYDK